MTCQCICRLYALVLDRHAGWTVLLSPPRHAQEPRKGQQAPENDKTTYAILWGLEPGNEPQAQCHVNRSANRNSEIRVANF